MVTLLAFLRALPLVMPMPMMVLLLSLILQANFVEAQLGGCDGEDPCPSGFSGFVIIPESDCLLYAQCASGAQAGADLVCPAQTVFYTVGQYCNWAVSTPCDNTPCPPTAGAPTPELTNKPTVTVAQTELVVTPTVDISSLPDQGGNDNNNNIYNGVDGDDALLSIKPTEGEFPDRLSRSPTLPQPTAAPIQPTSSSPYASPTDSPTYLPTTPGPTFAPSNAFRGLRDRLIDRADEIKRQVMVSHSASGGATSNPSVAYTFDDLLTALDIMMFEVPPGAAFFLGQGDGRGMEYGLVNLAAFLATAMSEGIRYDSCEEFNTDIVSTKLPISNACGQHWRSYQDEICPAWAPYHCPVDTEMEITASVGPTAGEYNPPPLQCHPSNEQFSGFYDPLTGEVITSDYDYNIIASAYANAVGRTDVEGCCWWGRGVLWTRGTCIMGKLNFYLGNRAFKEGYLSRYPDIDFCSDPGAICKDAKTHELRWVIGLMEWSDRIQSYYDADYDWDYMDQLVKFVDGGMTDDSFMAAVSRIVFRGCHDESLCPPNEIPFKENRINDFNNILFEVFRLPLTDRPTMTPKKPTQEPTGQPTNAPSVVFLADTEFPTFFPTQTEVEVITLPGSNSGYSSKESYFVGILATLTVCVLLLIHFDL